MKWLKRLVAALGVLVAVAAGGLVVHRFWPRHTPPGQPPLKTLSSADPIKTALNEAASERRLLVLLSPTCPTCVAGAKGLGELLEKTSAAGLRTVVVWMPVIQTDIAAPTSAKLALIRGSHVQQFWDPKHFISRELLAVARAHLDRLSSDTREMLQEATVAWDVVALFPPGARWETELPWPAVWGFPVVDSLDEIRERLASGGPNDSSGSAGGPHR